MEQIRQKKDFHTERSMLEWKLRILRVFLSTSSLYILFVPVSLLISCDFFNAPYTGLILSYSTAGVCVIIIHKAMSMIKILSLTWYLKDNECEAFS